MAIKMSREKNFFLSSNRKCKHPKSALLKMVEDLCEGVGSSKGHTWHHGLYEVAGDFK